VSCVLEQGLIASVTLYIISVIEYTGGVPYYILKPILQKATAEQLATFEHYNPYLMEESDALWEVHVNRRFKGKKRDEFESWREMYYVRIRPNRGNNG
jgi:elongin-A